MTCISTGTATKEAAGIEALKAVQGEQRKEGDNHAQQEGKEEIAGLATHPATIPLGRLRGVLVERVQQVYRCLCVLGASLGE